MRSCNLCGEPWATHTTACRTTQPPTADATASARLTAEADADGTGSRVEESERVCARCEGAAKRCDKYAEHRRSFQEDNAQDEHARGEAIATAEELGRSIRSACLAAHHVREDAEWAEQARNLAKFHCRCDRGEGQHYSHCAGSGFLRLAERLGRREVMAKKRKEPGYALIELREAAHRWNNNAYTGITFERSDKRLQRAAVAYAEGEGYRRIPAKRAKGK